MNSKGTILIVEDQAGFRMIYEDLLVHEGYAVITAGDGELGWELIKEKKPSLVLLDLGLPKVDGFEVLRRMRADPEAKAIPVIIFSVMGEPNDIKKAMDMGANDYTVKGFYTPRQVLSKIKNLLKDAKSQNTINSYRLLIQENRGNALRMEQDLGLEKGFWCSKCDVEMEAEFFPDYARSDGHWFATRFVCPKCQKSF